MRAKSSYFVNLALHYLADRRALGFALRIAGKRLLAFARFADGRCPAPPLTLSTAVAWARAAKRASPITWARRLEIVRPFARYLRQFDPATEVPPGSLFGPAHRRLAPRIYTAEELHALLGEARRLGPREGLRPAAVATILGLLACTGLRVSEALGLSRDDVDLDTGLLRIRETKFCKSRLVPFHHSAAVALGRYADLRDRRVPRPASPAFFLVAKDAALTYSKLRTAFRRLRFRLGWEPRPGNRPPRVHDLRHTFACRRLLQWHDEGLDVEAHLYDLSTYLGHSKVTDTYWYLSGFPELMDLVGRRFERFASSREEARS
jgi:integrase